VIPVLVEVALGLAALPVVLASAYLLLLSLLSARRPAPAAAVPHLRFDFVIPAHDEEGGIAATVRSLLSVDYPPELRRILVVADNCSDATAEQARQAGATVLVRQDPQRGKGYALAFAFARVLADGLADAVVVVDADTVVSTNLLTAFAARLDAGARAIQAHYGVRNTGASWRTRLMAIAFALVHSVRSLGRERLGCSAGLRGNGMCFAPGLFQEVPYQAFSIVEDLEYGIRLGLVGHRVHYAAEAEVLGEMPSGEATSRSQRQRWEGGRWEMARRHALHLVGRGLLERNRVLLDLGIDLLVSPLAYLAAAALVGLGLGSAARLYLGSSPLLPWAFGASLAALTVYVVRGWWLSGTGLRGLEALVMAPVYLLWKVGLALGRRRHPRDAWVRTTRERGP
jgi:1,2-diacylglycerol 3-beta-glucosyltransferase